MKHVTSLPMQMNKEKKEIAVPATREADLKGLYFLGGRVASEEET